MHVALRAAGAARCAPWRAVSSARIEPQYELAFIGAGKMAEALLGGIVKQGVIPNDGILVYDPSPKQTDHFRDKFQGVSIASSVKMGVADAKTVILSCKPQNLGAVYAAGHGRISPDTLVISICAGVTVEEIIDGLGCQNVVRSMPNTPALVQKGITVWTGTAGLSEDKAATAAQLLECVGKQIHVVDESFLDMATALSGSGPAYVLMLMESMVDVGVHMGFPRDVATELVLATTIGTAELAQKVGDHPAILRNNITSPGGTTAAANYQLEKGNFRTVVADGIWAAYRRSLELGKQNSNVGPGRTRDIWEGAPPTTPPR